MPESFHTIVIGGGIAGLACTHRLVRALGPDKVRLLEASDYLGGHVRTTREAGYQLDWGPNGFLDREPAMLAWIRELGLEGELVQANQAAARRYLMMKGRLVELVGPPRFLLSPALSVAGRARLLMEPLIPPKRDDEAESVYDFAKRRIGREAADTLVSAMVLGIFGGDAKQLSLEHCFPRMAAMERDHGSLFKAMLAKRREAKSGGAAGSPMGPGGTLTSLRRGIGRLAERVTEVLGNVAQMNTRATRVMRLERGFEVVCRAKEQAEQTIRCENLVLAVPAYVAAQLCQVISPEVTRNFSGMNYASVVVLCVGIRNPKFYLRTSDPGVAGGLRTQEHRVMHGFGYLIPPGERTETMGCLWTSSIFPESVPDGCLLFRVLFGGVLHPEAIDWSPDQLMAAYYRDVQTPLAFDGQQEVLRVMHHRRAIPQYGLNHGEVLAAAGAAERAHPGLYFTGSALRGVAMIDCVADARRVADRILAPGA